MNLSIEYTVPFTFKNIITEKVYFYTFIPSCVHLFKVLAYWDDLPLYAYSKCTKRKKENGEPQLDKVEGTWSHHSTTTIDYLTEWTVLFYQTYHLLVKVFVEVFFPFLIHDMPDIFVFHDQ